MSGVKVCPNCGSTDLGHDSLSVISRLSLSGAKECRECGYSGIFPQVPPEKVEAFRERDREDEVVETAAEPQGLNYGRLALGALLFLLGVGASSFASWGNGLLAGLLALAVGAAVVVEELTKDRFRD